MDLLVCRLALARGGWGSARLAAPGWGLLSAGPTAVSQAPLEAWCVCRAEGQGCAIFPAGHPFHQGGACRAERALSASEGQGHAPRPLPTSGHGPRSQPGPPGFTLV